MFLARLLWWFLDVGALVLVAYRLRMMSLDRWFWRGMVEVEGVIEGV